MPILIIAAGLVLVVLAVAGAVVWVRLGDLHDLLLLLAWRREGRPLPQISQYHGFF